MENINLNQILVNLLLGLITTGSGVLIPFLFKFIRAKVASNKSIMLQTVYAELETIVQNVVNETQQVTVAAIKAKAQDGKLTTEDASKIKQEAISKALSLINANTIKLLGSEGQNVQKLVETIIESQVYQKNLVEGSTK